jgi:hypothetical protein
MNRSGNTAGTINPGYITAQKIIIWKKETGEYPKMGLSGLRDFCEGRES